MNALLAYIRRSVSAQDTIPPSVLRILGIILESPRPMTIREIADQLGFSSNTQIKESVDRLQAAGLVDWERGRSRTIHATCVVDCIVEF